MCSNMEDVKDRLRYTFRLIREVKRKRKECKSTNGMDVRKLKTVDIDIRQMEFLFEEIIRLLRSCVKVINYCTDEWTGAQWQIDAFERIANYVGEFVEVETKCSLIMDELLGKRKEELSSGGVCKVCFLRVAEVVTTPCYHYVSCKRCSYRLGSCPVCRTTTERRLSIGDIEEGTRVYRC
ncbi:E3 ubiquitin-protein ligase XIAP-like [Anneissia japonica]|uniref:E3 ubiquitin-protein ligase XIAP-like n=1 Tax=Anneissia japonica TaxID=1529436 RepID=UPI001425A90D|nr:E3 ubiquitin-protein ligase XIAP-like [Anneissia japonica]